MSHIQWALARVDETLVTEDLRSQRTVQQLVDSLLTLRGQSAKGVFGLSPRSLALADGERETLERRIRAALVVHRDAFQKASDAVSLVELQKIAEMCNLPELRLQERFALRCDPLGDTSSLTSEWNGLIARLRHAKDASVPLAWGRVAEFFVDDPPKKVEFGPPNLDALYEFALRYEQSSKQVFSRELAAILTIADGLILDEMWYLAPVKEWSWEEDGLRIGCGHFGQGSLCLETADGTKNLADAALVDRDDDGVEAYRYENFAALLNLLLPGPEALATNEEKPASSSEKAIRGVRKRPWWKFWSKGN